MKSRTGPQAPASEGALWRDLIPATDRRIYEAAGYGGGLTLGQRPVMLVIDVTYGFLGREPQEIMDAIREYPTSCGRSGWAAAEQIAALLPAARSGGRPIIYSAGFESATGSGFWREKHPTRRRDLGDAREIPDLIAPVAEADILIRKTKPSLFHGTPLLDLLVSLRADTVVVTGGTTSGCVRATVVDAASFGFVPVIVEDAVFDRSPMSHAMSLFEMEQKYANVTPSTLVREYLQRCAQS